MTEKKIDARVKYTKLMIRNAFAAMLRDMPLAKVTVTGICARAGINRATFYAHYKDPFDLMESLENEMLENIMSIAGDSVVANQEDLRRLLPDILRFIQSESELCLVFMSDLSDSGFVKRCMNLISGYFVRCWMKQSGLSRTLAEQLFLYGAMGSVGLLQQWLKASEPQSPEYMSELIISLFIRGASSLVNEKDG